MNRQFARGAGIGYSATTASAAHDIFELSVVPETNIQNVRMVSMSWRCWRERSERSVIIREPDDSFGDRGLVRFSVPAVGGCWPASGLNGRA